MMRTTTWNGLGTEAKDNNLDTLLKSADLDYTVTARDLYVDAGFGEEKILVPNKKMIVREDNNDLFGIVSDRYQICQNRDALDFVNYIDGIELEKAGQMWGMVYLIARMPEVEILGDKIRPNLIFQNSHDGSCSIKSTICMLRIVCQNQFVRAFHDSPATVSISHLGNVEEKLLAAQETMRNLYNYIQCYKDEATEMATKKITATQFDEILKKYFSQDEELSDRKNAQIVEDQDNFLKAYNADDNQNFIGTQWGLVNAYSDYITHREPLRKSKTWEDSRFYWSLSPTYMNNFVEFVKSVA